MSRVSLSNSGSPELRITDSTSPENLRRFMKDSRADLLTSLKAEQILKSKEIEEALLNVPREKFLWPGTPESAAYFDEPVQLGDTGQTISAPHMIVMMLEELQLTSGLKVLEIGTGSGYNAALISYIVSRGISEAAELLVISIERNGTLVKFARKNIEDVHLNSCCKVIEGDGSLGYPQQADQELYDRIIVTAGAPHVPVFLKKQLKVGGILEVPVGANGFQRLMILKKNTMGEFEQHRSVDCVFVPLIGSDAHKD
ncbi:MAG TPA: protein-L-isoaspartate O-methyltransferase [Nitrososphaerales archaeon]|nr:protein-L-isoaspartate O-methyltransferase [Nitrososphaerales archaeon]